MHYIHLIIVSMFFWIYIIDSYFFVSTSFDTTYNSHNVLSKRTSQTDKLVFWQKLLLTIIFTFFSDITQWGLILIIVSIFLLFFLFILK